MACSRIYLDHAASVPPAPGVREAMAAVRDVVGNPSSAHEEGRRAKAELEGARSRAAKTLGCRPRELVFTASGTLASWIGLVGAARGREASGRGVVVSAVEHPCVAEAAAALEERGFTTTRVAPTQDGHVDADSFLRAVSDNTAVAALMLANHESGALMPVREVADALAARGVPLLCDACLGPGRVGVCPVDLGADLIAYSAHKFGGPRGMGLLYVRRRTRVQPHHQGGLQEEKLFAGTENVAGAVGLAVALEHAVAETASRRRRYDDLLARFLGGIEDVRPWLRVTPVNGLPGVATLEFPGVEGEAAMINLDLEGVAVSTGSRCALGAAEASPALLAMGLSKARAASTLRISVGEGNDESQIDCAARTLGNVIGRLRSLAQP